METIWGLMGLMPEPILGVSAPSERPHPRNWLPTGDGYHDSPGWTTYTGTYECGSFDNRKGFV